MEYPRGRGKPWFVQTRCPKVTVLYRYEEESHDERERSRQQGA